MVLGCLVLLSGMLRSRDREQEPEDRGERSGSGGDETVILPLEDAIDLHAFSPAEVVAVAEEYVRAAARAGFREVRLIHGRGIGFQRKRIREMLRDHPAVKRYGDAPPERGGWGATVVTIRTDGGRQAP